MNGIQWMPIVILAQQRVGPIDPAKIAQSIWEHPAFYATIVGVLALAGFIAWMIKRHYDAKLEPGYANDEELFTDLCQAHSLDAAQVSLLRELAAHHGLTEPARLFIEAGHFTAELSSGLKEKGEELEKLREVLFSTGA